MYPHLEIEKKWQEYWEKNGIFEVTEDTEKKKFYCLDMFPYPSSNGLHVGHPEGYTATDIYARYLRMNGYNVLHPMGWDAFGLPTENFAIKEGVHPAKTTAKNINNFRRQIKSFGFSYDWSREVNTSSPEYYKWTQWIFLQLYKKGLAYKRKAPVNWCTSCQTVLANEQVVGGSCDRCYGSIIQKELEQWFLKVTDYADELLLCLGTLDWPSSIKASQRNWIGKSEGARLTFPVANTDLAIEVFTTRPDTLYGATYMVLAPEHTIIENLKSQISNLKEVQAYLEKTKKKTELERTHLEKEKTGVELKGIKAINPANGEEIPIWIADYVLMGYGTGAIMAVPAHDTRDFAFAKKYNLPIRMVVCPHYPAPTCPVLDEAYEGDGHLVESGEFTGLPSQEAKKKITEQIGGTMEVRYKLRDWLISRQRYWGAPIPIIYCDTCKEQAVPEIDLPVLLPTDVDFCPTGESPLVRSNEFHKVKCPSCGGDAKRESDTMDTFVCSSWYFLRYASPHEHDQPFRENAIRHWLPVDMYVGGAEHAVLHLLYARFMTKVLRDCGFISFDEPFTRLRNQGLVMGEDGEKMSKSRGNVINPDDIVERLGADTMRMYEMFMGPFETAKPWNTNGAIGVRRFLDRLWTIMNACIAQPEKHRGPSSLQLTKTIHKTVKKVTEDIVTFNFNTAISALMICANALHDELIKGGSIDCDVRKKLILIISPFAPHMAEEFWSIHGDGEILAFHPWPSYDDKFVTDETVTVAVQINGKLRDSMELPTDTSDDEARSAALEREAVKKWIGEVSIKKIIVVKNKIVNIVTAQ